MLATAKLNMLRLWQARTSRGKKIDLAAFNNGKYSEAVRERNEIEAITAIFIPTTVHLPAEKELRLKQEYFSHRLPESLPSLITISINTAQITGAFSDRTAIHTNDTHPALCVPER